MGKIDSLPKLTEKAQKVFNAWVRRRDTGEKCISCGSYKVVHASHYFSAGSFSSLRFNEFNVNGSCLKCNNFLHGNLIMYRIGLIEKIGEENVKELENFAINNRLKKWDYEELIEIINKYK